MIKTIKKQVNFLRYEKNKQKYLKERSELLQKYLAMPQPLSADLVNEMEAKKKELMVKYGI